MRSRQPRRRRVAGGKRVLDAAGSSAAVGHRRRACSKIRWAVEPLRPLESHSYVESASRRVVPVAPSVQKDSFGAFYRREYDPAVRLAWLLTGSRPVAEDVAQDAMAAVYRAFERVESPSAYLRRAVVNTVRSWHRDERRHQERSMLLARDFRAVDAPDAELLDAVARAGLPTARGDRCSLLGRVVGGRDRPVARLPSRDREVARLASAQPSPSRGTAMTTSQENFEDRLRRVRHEQAQALEVHSGEWKGAAQSVAHRRARCSLPFSGVAVGLAGVVALLDG